MNARILIASLALAALAGSGSVALAGDTATPSSGDAAHTSYAIEIRDFAFQPKVLDVKAGSRIAWTNRDDEPHLIVSTQGAFKPSPALDTDDSFGVVLAKPGVYDYYCGMHPMMVGRIVVH
jgi:plastocyanin